MANLELQVTRKGRIDEEASSSERVTRFVRGERGMGSARHAGGVSQGASGTVGQGDRLQAHHGFHVLIVCGWKFTTVAAEHGCWQRVVMVVRKREVPGHHIDRFVQPRCKHTNDFMSMQLDCSR